ncbi:DUF58 domain-containing protein [Photobacterium minamisatsumaniensis]|uniref:DUF58 domain-containing protein n=1 Tax=Photobacterium minamisatsumaniensis TaxID=2910233 RepID=UPI003D0EF1F0
MTLPAHSDGVTLSLAELLHYQKQSVRWLPPARSIWSYLSGHHDSAGKGRGMDFAEVRPYQKGDDVRSIDWRITARTGKPHTKLFTEERECPVMVAVDLSATMQYGTKLLYKSVQSAHIASLICWLTVAQKDRIGAVVIGNDRVEDCVPTARQQGPLHIMNTMKRVQERTLHVQLPQSSGPSLGGETNKETFFTAMSQLHRLCPKGSDLIIVSDFNSLSEKSEKRLMQLAQHNHLRLLHVFDPIEQGETAYRGRFWLGDQRRSLQVNFGRESTLSSLQQDFERHQARLKALAHQLRSPLYSVSAGQPLLEQLGGIHG